MSNMDKVNEIRDAIARLPKEYRTLVQEEKVWAAAHPALNALAWFGAGVVATLVAVAMFVA